MIFYLISFYLLLLSLIYFLLGSMLLESELSIVVLWVLMKSMVYNIEFLLYLDWKVFMFLSVVSLITSMVLIYSVEYMGSGVNLQRFMQLILVFYLSMKFMLISPNMFSILLGWDGLGVSSYFLVVFYQNKKSANSGLVTILMNRIGDISILVLIGILLSKNSLSMLFLTELNQFYLLLMILASMTKSAQVPFSQWLPLAMAAPTPVSSLVHSSTLVTAGVYMLIRFSYILDGWIMKILMVISCWTMMMSSISALFEFDLKKIIALSTLSQLGLMILSISMNLVESAFFHLLTHAMFKSLLFLCSGIIIHKYFGVQDIRLISFMGLNLPLVSMIFNISSLSLCGVPFLSGFYSKDLLVESFSMNKMNMVIYTFMFISMANTVAYSLRLILYLSGKVLFLSNNEKCKASGLMILSLYTLFIMTIVYGAMLSWLMFGALNMVILECFIKLKIYYLLTLGFIFSLMSYKLEMKLNMNFYSFLNNMWGLQFLWKKTKMSMFKLNNKMIMLKEMGWIEFLSVKSFIYALIKFNSLDKLMKLKFFVIMVMISYIILSLYLFN